MPSLLEALEQKYFADCDFPGDGDGVQEKLISIFIPRVSPLVSVPELLVLNDCGIDCAGDFEAIKDKCQRVRELDLAQNKLEDWEEVFRILRHMPRIEFLNLSKNQLMGPINKGCTLSVGNLKGLVLNGTYLDWLCIDTLLENLPHLEELHLSLNEYKEILIDTDADTEVTNTENALLKEAPLNANNCHCDTLKSRKKISAHRSLKTLHFTGNPIESWQEICRLGRVFPHLENLVLAGCPIKSIEASTTACTLCADRATNDNENDPPYVHFYNLLLLNLSCAKINTWDDIDKLAKFPKLQNLRIQSLPLWQSCECTEHERRQLLIARLPNVTLLNGGGAINADEREDAERAFIRHYMDKPHWERPQRYNELIAKHGQLEPLVNVNLKPDKRIKIYLTFRDKTELRFVDIYRTVADLKVKLEKIIGIPSNKMRLYYLDKDYKEWGPEEMRFPNKLLYSYNIQAEDEIIVDEKK